MIRNIHERELPDAPGVAGRLLDGLSAADDRLWPKDRWPAMRFDRPLKVGARGGHGPVRYSVSDLDPGRRVTFRFTGRRFPGYHWFEVFTRDGRTVLRHTLEGRPRGRMLLIWPLAIRWLHDACVEDALDRAAGAAPRRHSAWVRFLRATYLRTPRPAARAPSGSAAARPRRGSRAPSGRSRA